MKTAAFLKVIANIVVWLLFFILILSVTTSMGAATFTEQLSSYNFYIFCFVYLFVFYFNSVVLFPYLYLRKKYLLYAFVILLMFSCIYFITPFDNLLSHNNDAISTDIKMPNPPPYLNNPPPHRDNPPPRLGDQPPNLPPGADHKHFIDLNSIILFLFVLLASMALQILREWRSSNQRAIIAERDKKTAELAFLKAHVNPHFLFNTLNNIYSMAIISHEQTAVSILKLSNLMRYITESAAVDYIAMESEVECIVDYVDLQKIRLNNKVYLDFSVEGNFQNKKIAPLILMPFIENIFKYGISNHHQSTINIKLFVEQSTITFYSQNKIFNPGKVYDREGFGIQNAKQRLAFLYPHKHALEINNDKDLYTVQLILQTE